MQQHPNDSQGPGSGWHPIQDSKWLVSWIIFLAQVLAAPVELMIRTRFGWRYFGLPHAIAVLGLPIWLMFWQHENPSVFIVFWLATLLMQVRARLEQLAMRARRDVEHSRYNGRSRLAWVLRRMSERTIKGMAEPLFVLAIGLMVRPDEPPLGSYLIVAGLSLWINNAVIRFRERTIAQDLHDAWIEQRTIAERVRALRGGRFG